MMTQGGLVGLRILVVEDEMLITVLIEDMLQGLGCHVAGPVSGSMPLRPAHKEAPDAAHLFFQLVSRRYERGAC